MGRTRGDAFADELGSGAMPTEAGVEAVPGGQPVAAAMATMG